MSDYVDEELAYVGGIEALAAITRLLGETVPEAEEAGVGVLVTLGVGWVEATPHHSVPAGEISYVFAEVGDLGPEGRNPEAADT